MFDSSNLKSMLEISEKLSQQIKVEMRIFDETINQSIKNAPDKDKTKLEQMKGLSQRAFALSKQGNFEEANELIKEFKNGCKSS